MLDIRYQNEDSSIAIGKTVAYSQILPAENDLRTRILAANPFGSRPESDRMDLFPFYAILVSAGWNKNTDVFDPIELWRSRGSPEDKPINYMHDQKKIIGHITDNIVVGEDLKPISNETKEEDLPYRLHIITAGVIYTVWEDQLVQTAMNKIVADMNTGKLFVSMECLFRSFDYLLMKSNGEQDLLPRNEKTSFLTKHLRQYGGTGTYQHYTLGRLLRSITFSAQGIVDNPANPESIISTDLNVFDTTFANLGYITLDKFNQEINPMPETVVIEDHPAYKSLASKYDALLAKASSDKEKQEEEKDKVLAAKDEELKKMKDEEKNDKREIAELKAALPAKEDLFKKKEEDTKKTEDDAAKAMASVKAELDAERETRKAYEEASRKAKRTQALFNADKTLTKDKIEKLVADFLNLHDDTFNAMVATIADYSKRAPKVVTAEDVINKPVTAEVNPPLGVVSEGEVDKVVAHVGNWFNSGKKTKGSK